MPHNSARQLTERQQAVMEKIDRRLSIKVIAQDLGVSETRINQHIRALKDIFEAESLGDLVKRYRESQPDPTAKGYREAVYSKNQVPHGGEIADSGSRVDQGELVMSDVLPMIEQAPWLRAGEPKVVPGVLDGEHAVLFRLAAIIGIAFGILAAVVLSVTAAKALSEAMDGSARVPVEEIRPPA